ncbi:PIG-L deacetylase family protein [Phormidesmis priestleyi]
MKKLLNRIQNKLHWLQKYESPAWLCWFQYLGLALSSPAIALSQKSALIVSPHQDDETLGCGGLIALKREQGIAVQVVFVTDGAASHAWHPNFKSGEIAPIRKQEALEALSILGVSADQIHFLNHRDGKLRYTAEGDRQQATDQLTQIIRDFEPGEVYVTHRHDRSADHEVTHILVENAIADSGQAIDLFEYPIWILWKTRLFQEVKLSELAGARRLSIKPVQLKKRQALAAYRSQYLPIDGDGGRVLPHGFLRRFSLPYEVFFKSDR